MIKEVYDFKGYIIVPREHIHLVLPWFARWFSDSIGGKYNEDKTACAYLLDWADAEENEVIQKMRLFEAHYGAKYGLFTKESGDLV